MSEVDRTYSPAAAALSFGLAVGIASLALELLLPVVVRPAGDLYTATEPLVRTVFFAGAVLRWPLTIGAFSTLAFALDGGRGGKALGRAVAVTFALAILIVDATSYAWLGARGRLFHLGTSLDPLELFRGTGAMLAAAGVLGAAAAGWALERALLPWFDRRFARTGAIASDAITLAVLSVIGIAAAGGSRGSLALGSTPPVVAMVVRMPAATVEAPEEVDEPAEEPPPADGIAIPPPDLRALVYEALGTESPTPLADPSRPFCRSAAEPTAPASSPRSLVLLVVRGLDAEAITAATPVMPALAALAREEASFSNVIAGADDPTQGLVQILSGVAPLAPARYHEMARTPRLPSLPRTLRSLGIDSYFVSTTDLSPGRERTYLRSLAFDRVEEPSFAEELAAAPSTGGDATTFDRIRERLGATRGRPRLLVSTLASGLSPDDPSLSPSELRARRNASLAALDAELARFVADFRRDEAPSGAVLAITSDAVDPSVVVNESGAEASKPSFHVPLVLVNLPRAAKELARTRSGMLAGLHDVAQTLLGLEGQGAVGCVQGHDLLSTRTPLPSARKLPAFGGADQRYAYIFDGRFRWQLDRTHIEEAGQVFDLSHDRGLAHDLFDANDPDTDLMRELVLSFVAMGRYQAMNDRFLPGRGEITARPLPAVQTPTRAATVSGASIAAITSAVAERKRGGFDTVLLEVTLDASNAPLLAGLPLGEALSALARPLRGLTVMLDIAMPEPPSTRRSVQVSRAIVAAIASANLNTQPILMPKDPVMATSLAARSDYPVFVRLPGHALDLVDTALGFGVDGIVFGSDLAARSIIERARLEGLRVAVDDAAALEALADSGENGRPDYVFVGTTRSASP